MSFTPIVVGRFGKAFGVNGWLKVKSFTSPQENILNFKLYFIQKNNIWEKIVFEDSKKHSGNIIVKLYDYNSPEEVSGLTNINIGVLRKQFPKLYGDDYYWVDLIGLEVVNQEGIVFGKVQDLFATGSNDVLIVEGKRRRLIPYTSSVIIDVDLSGKAIHVNWEADF